jgi:cytochrome oxidase assembly protein ShyY1
MELLRPRWVAGHVIVFVLTVAFVTAGFWQLARNNEANDELDREKAAFARPAPDLETVDLQRGATANERVSATGTFDAEHQALLRNRSRDGKTGYDVLTPLRLANGDAVLVDRGWVDLDGVARGVDGSDIPSGTVIVRGPLQRASALRAGEEAKDEGGVVSLPRVAPAVVEDDAGYDLIDAAYVRAEFQDPPPPADAPKLPEPKPTSEVNHVSYAFQWFAFAAIALIGWPIVLRRTLRRRHA